jgi:hypothetical protein
LLYKVMKFFIRHVLFVLHHSKTIMKLFLCNISTFHCCHYNKIHLLFIIHKIFPSFEVPLLKQIFSSLLTKENSGSISLNSYLFYRYLVVQIFKVARVKFHLLKRIAYFIHIQCILLLLCCT